ncbi:MAG: HEPN domain-containing protein [Saprospirales bacterium]|nr:HEPN domain-containing protein [Saprospirales bacterium]
MMTSEQRNHLIHMRIEQAEKAITQVEFCLKNNQLDMAANRVYYGMFYALLALGLLKGFETSKHLQLIGWFNKTFVFTEVFPKQFTRLLKDAFDTRTDADYKVNKIPTATEIEASLADMKLFISTIKAWIEAHPAT